ncbi:MAG: hypothetical protein QOJ09_2667 [Actinomycetota bacterium]|jgi:AcrR family transcriptional regulator|nr:hypothetical protein [Actinomycetota bacterium]
MSTRTTARKRMTANDRREVIERAATEVFAERGYHSAAVDEIARRSGISVPVLYDHFRSKRNLYERLIERHYAELRSVWFEFATHGESLAAWLEGAVDAWFAHVEQNPFAGRMLFQDTTGDPEIAAIHRDIQRSSRAEVLPLLVHEADKAEIDLGDAVGAELTWETMRAVLQGLAMWWYDHPDVSRHRIVTAAMNAIWIGFERLLAGEEWQPRAT